ncbi:sulfurtransferase complex subunit TusD [Litchfieldella xinjiangensis]|uniref:sulfurtransferase complex subunit TusD n=1 Tax=Litchfieldella xinjiangensis TaxID=1166948 RepID=UPI0005BE4173|nr:sulfurtransferase complex subunit TusD [Halomonas xinjiangensis]
MQYALLVQGSPYSYQASHSALRFAQAVVRRGHSLTAVFFYHDGVYNAARLAAPPQDEPHLYDAWAQLHREHDTELLVCIAAALRRGLMDERESSRHGKAGHSLEPPFILTGLGQLIEASTAYDRLISFSP